MTDETTVEKFPPLEEKCPECDGSGARNGYAGNCFDCNGSGYQPTEFGKAVLKLISHGDRSLWESPRRRHRSQLAEGILELVRDNISVGLS